MANAFGGFMSSGITIHQDISSENSNGALRKNKMRDDIQVKPPATKRAALGLITNTTRVQPSRAAKQGTVEGFMSIGSENMPMVKSTKSAFSMPDNVFSTQSFTIHMDDQTENSAKPRSTNVLTSREIVSSQQQRLTLHSGVTSLRPPLVTVDEPIVIHSSPPASLGSPMILDTSIDAQNLSESLEKSREHRIICVPDYSDDIYKHIREMEVRYRPKAGYMRKQPDITTSMRNILVDWLVEVAEEYKLHRETLCLSVNYIDRFLSHMSVLRGKLQLVGAASMFLAAKFEEIYPPEVGEFVYITDDTYSKKQVLRMEHLILKVLSFDVAVPTVNCFCERFIQEGGYDDKTKSLAMYLCELTLVDSDPFLKYLPSQIAAAAVCLANHTFNRQPWPEHLRQKSLYTISDFEVAMQDLYTTFCHAPNHPQQAIREKYMKDKHHQVSMLCPPATIPTAEMAH